jgi:hypothetical protein
MEVAGGCPSEGLATTQAELSDRRASAARPGHETGGVTMKLPKPSKTVQQPNVEIALGSKSSSFQPGDFLTCEYLLFLPNEKDKLSAIEASVIWYVQGKGDEDLGVHFFERRQKSTLHTDALLQPQRLSTVLPPCPLSYDGVMIKVIWCVRIRLFFTDGRQLTFDHPFRLGNVQCLAETSAKEYETLDPDPDDGSPAPMRNEKKKPIANEQKDGA